MSNPSKFAAMMEFVASAEDEWMNADSSDCREIATNFLTSVGNDNPYWVTPNQFTERKAKGGHIMMSYSKSNKNTVEDIYKQLRYKGYQVWMDIYDMRGDTVDAMAEAVEKSQIFIMCMSTGYQDSNNCKKEAKYATQIEKKIIPLKMEKDFTPTGWLGLISGTKKFYDFSGKYPFENKMRELIQEIEHLY